MKNMFGGDSDFSIDNSPHHVVPSKVRMSKNIGLSSFESSEFETSEFDDILPVSQGLV